MAYDESLAQRLRALFAGRDDVVEKKMFGGIAFMVRGNMCVGVMRDQLMARVGPEQQQEALAQPHARVMDFTRRPMKGYIYVAPEGIADTKGLKKWVGMCERFNATLPAKQPDLNWPARAEGPKSPNAWRDPGIHHLGRSDHAEALTHFEKARELDPLTHRIDHDITRAAAHS